MAPMRQIAPINTPPKERKAHVVHARFTATELAAVQKAAACAELTMSAFMRSLTLEGAGVRPFLTEEDRAVFDLLHRDLRAIGMNLNSLLRLAHQRIIPSELGELLKDLQPVAAGLALELCRLERRNGRSVGGRP